jgi:hypothetical protein
VSWDQQFFDPIELPKGKKLVILRDAPLYITELPNAEHEAQEWQAAMGALILVAEHNGPTMLAHISMMRASNHRSDVPSRRVHRHHRSEASRAARTCESCDGDAGRRRARGDEFQPRLLETVAANLWLGTDGLSGGVRIGASPDRGSNQGFKPDRA